LYVIAGFAKGKKLYTPRDRLLRPTTGKVKECIFNIISEDIKNKEVLDLFAGCGTLGIEALSRGAKFCRFVDLMPASIKYLKKNLIATDMSDNGKIYKEDVFRFIRRTSKYKPEYNYIFADPPYDFSQYHELIRVIEETKLLALQGLFFLEHEQAFEGKTASGNLYLYETRKFGSTKISIFTWRNL